MHGLCFTFHYLKNYGWIYWDYVCRWHTFCCSFHQYWEMCTLYNWIDLIKTKYITTRMGFEPTRGDPNGLAVHRLNLSATSSAVLCLIYNLDNEYYILNYSKSNAFLVTNDSVSLSVKPWTSDGFNEVFSLVFTQQTESTWNIMCFQILNKKKLDMKETCIQKAKTIERSLQNLSSTITTIFSSYTQDKKTK